MKKYVPVSSPIPLSVTVKWVDISGLIAPKSEIDALIDGIESGTVNRLKYINAEFERMHQNYYI